ncbi:MAG: CpsB protein [Firmicutes bacterium]|nr:CpsB protein [Bacillota bacterium]
MVDIHCHILPGLDDGPGDMDTSMRMLENAVRCGTKAIIATPHYYRGYFENGFEEVLRNLDTLRGAAAESGIDIELYPGQEVFLDGRTVEMYKRGDIKGLNMSRYLLVEMPMHEYSDSFLDMVYELRLLGAVPVIAHPERYDYIINDVNKLNPFIDEGCLFQINAGSIEGIFGKTVQKASKVLIENGLCNFVASDAHTNGRRNTGLQEALEIAENISRTAAEIANGNSELLLRDGKIKANARISVKKSFFSFLKQV